MSRTKIVFFSSEKMVFILNRGLMSKTGFFFFFFFFLKLVYFIFSISSKTENILSLELQILQCINLPTGNTTTLKKKTPYQF